jgi:hypothetical protein
LERVGEKICGKKYAEKIKESNKSVDNPSRMNKLLDDKVYVCTFVFRKKRL